MNILGFLKDAKPAPSKAADRYRQYRTTGNGKIEVYLPPQHGDALRAKLIEAEKIRDDAINSAGEKRADALKALRADYETRRAAIEAENRQAVTVANNEFEATEDKLLAEYSAPLSREQIALLTTKPGEVVHLPAQAQGGAK